MGTARKGSPACVIRRQSEFFRRDTPYLRKIRRIVYNLEIRIRRYFGKYYFRYVRTYRGNRVAYRFARARFRNVRNVIFELFGQIFDGHRMGLGSTAAEFVLEILRIVPKISGKVELDFFYFEIKSSRERRSIPLCSVIVQARFYFIFACVYERMRILHSYGENGVVGVGIIVDKFDRMSVAVVFYFDFGIIRLVYPLRSVPFRNDFRTVKRGMHILPMEIVVFDSSLFNIEVELVLT